MYSHPWRRDSIFRISRDRITKLDLKKKLPTVGKKKKKKTFNFSEGRLISSFADSPYAETCSTEKISERDKKARERVNAPRYERCFTARESSRKRRGKRRRSFGKHATPVLPIDIRKGNFELAVID